MPVKHTAFHCREQGAENGETARREMSVVGFPAIKDHNASLGASSSLFQFTSSKTVISALRGVGVFGSADFMAVSAFQELARSTKRELTQTSCLFK